jgi:hypothetical protein
MIQYAPLVLRLLSQRGIFRRLSPKFTTCSQYQNENWVCGSNTSQNPQQNLVHTQLDPSAIRFGAWSPIISPNIHRTRSVTREITAPSRFPQAGPYFIPIQFRNVVIFSMSTNYAEEVIIIGISRSAHNCVSSLLFVLPTTVHPHSGTE